jgi:hypothetical protein
MAAYDGWPADTPGIHERGGLPPKGTLPLGSESAQLVGELPFISRPRKRREPP